MMTPNKILERLRDMIPRTSGHGSLNLRGRGHRGLHNLANTCFLNVALQALFHTMPLARALLKGDFDPDVREHLEDPRILLLLYYIRMNFSVWMEDAQTVHRTDQNVAIRPGCFVDELRNHLPGWEFGMQHDAHETLEALLNIFHDLLSREVVYEIEGDSERLVDRMRIEATTQWARHYQKPSQRGANSGDDTHPREIRSRYSLILELFGGQYLERFNCKYEDCGHICYKYESFLSSTLQIEAPRGSERVVRTVEDALALHCDLEQLEEGNEWKCEKCERKSLPLRRSSYWLLPKEILVLSLKRFVTEEVGRGRYRSRKITKLIEYDPETPLDMYPYVSNGLSDTLFQLYAIICHTGSLHFGHYYAFARDSEGSWWKYNDEDVSPVTDPEELITPHAYMLLYRVIAN